MEEKWVRELVAYTTDEYDKKHGIEKESAPGSRTITAVISSETVDHDNEVVTALAMKNAMPVYMKNPVVLASHNHKLPDGTSPVIGKVTKWWQERDKTLCQIEFANTPLANQYYDLYSGGFQKAFSIGFNSHKRSSKYISGKSVTVHDVIDMYDLSAVSVGSNPDASAVTKEMKDYISKSFSDMESRIVKSVESLISEIKCNIDDQLEGIKALLIEKTNPNGCGGDSVGDPLIPSVEAQKSDMALIEKTLKELIKKECKS